MSNSNLNSTDLALSKRLRILCEDYDNRPYVVKRGVLSSIVKFLSNESLAVATNAAEALLSLSEHPENPTPMCREKALLPALSSAYKKYSEMAEEVPQQEQSNENEVPATDDEAEIPPSLPEPTSVPACVYLVEIIAKIVSHLEKSLSEVNEAECTNEAMDDPSRQGESSEYDYLRTGNVVYQQRSVVLDIPSLAEDNVNQLANLMESIQGIMSFTIDFNRHVVRLLLTTPTASVLRLLDDNGFISIILHEENVAANNFHHIGADGGLRYASAEDYMNNGRSRASRAHGHRRRKIKHKQKKNEKSQQGVLGYLASWM